MAREQSNQHSFHFQKKYGQNFLTDPKIPARMADYCAEAVRLLLGQSMFGQSSLLSGRSSENQLIPAAVLEIGPGAGILTRELAARFKKVIAVEIDETLLPILSESLADFDNVEVVLGDILAMPLAQLLNDHARGADGSALPVIVCANLPYYITTPILMKCIEQFGAFLRIVIMVQKEVARRLCAMPGDGDYGAVTASVGLYGSVQKLFDVPAGCFVPKPKVDSAVISVSPYQPPKYTDADVAWAKKLIRSAFAQRRKTLVNALSDCAAKAGGKQAMAQLISQTLNLPADVRGERLSPEQFVTLSKALSQRGLI